MKNMIKWVLKVSAVLVSGFVMVIIGLSFVFAAFDPGAHDRTPQKRARAEFIHQSGLEVLPHQFYEYK